MRMILVIKNNKGIAAIFLALAIIVLIAFVGLAVDIGYMYVTKGQLQNAADSAALAGASRLKLSADLTSFGNQSSARIAAQTYAGKNNAAGTPLTLDLNSVSNDANGDIVVGNWDKTRPKNPCDERFLPVPASPDGTCSARVLPSGVLLNAVKVIARRTGETGPGIGTNTQVMIFFGRILSLLPGGGPGWSAMSAKTQAIAIRPQVEAAPLPMCTQACTLFDSTPAPSSVDFILQNDPKPTPIPNGIAWTEFNQDTAIPLGPNQTVTDMIWGRTSAPNPLCSICITTNNGTGDVIKELYNAFNSTTYLARDKQIVGGKVVSWKVAVPVLDINCSSGTTACPPGAQPVPEHVDQIATITVSAVRANGNGHTDGITITSINCLGCPTFVPFSDHGAILVK
jgi:Flp pilus assembly protein TadG